MKIIKQGTPRADKAYRTDCDECDTVFEFRRHEADYVSDQRDGDFLSVKCPVCGHVQAITP